MAIYGTIYTEMTFPYLQIQRLVLWCGANWC